MQISSQIYHTLFSGVQDRQELQYLHLSNLGAYIENLFLRLYEFQNNFFNFWHYKDLDFTRSVDFLRGVTYQNYGVKNIFCENPVEVRSIVRTSVLS
jgi:hypothetical protein